MYEKYLNFILVFCISNGIAQIPIFDLHLNDLYKMQTGIGWPHTLRVVEGHDAQLRLARSLENQQLCQVTTPDAVTFDVQQPPSDRYTSWSEGCGIRIKHVTHADQGRWRLTAVQGDHNLTGWTEVYVQDDVHQYTAAPITLHDGEAHTNIDLTTLENSYCLVAQPFTDRTLVPGHCSVTLDRTTRAVQGNWHVLLGLPGRVEELPVDQRINVEAERLETGFIHGSNQLHLFCNLHHTEKNITFCRFQLTSAQSGYNVIDGLSDGERSYYGKGFAHKECGMTIEHPSAADYNSWRCTVGLQERVGTAIEQRTPLQALIRVTGPQSSTRRTVAKTETTAKVLFVQTDMAITISCEADESLNYCWFQHPNGTQFTPVPLVDEEQPFWYSGESLSVGDCGITLAHVSEVDGGIWTCHMGPRDQVGVEFTDRVSVRVTGPLAARDKEVSAMVGGNTTLYCHSSNGNRPLEYCRFLSPLYLGISVDETVTKENAILDRFYFTAGRDLDYGDCSLTIDPVQEHDVGVWTCAALVDNEILESRDTITLSLEVAQPRSVVGIVGMAVGLSALFLIFGGVMVYKYGKLSSLTIPWRRTNNTECSDTASLGMSVSYSGRSSTATTVVDANVTNARLSVASEIDSSTEQSGRSKEQDIPNIINLD